MPLLFLSAPGIGTRYSDSYSEHLPAVVRSRKREAIITYKKIPPMIQLGNLSYRLISPYNDRGAFSLMLYTPQKTCRVLAYKIQHYCNQIIPRFRMDRLKADKQYRITELNRKDARPLPLDNKMFSGRILMKQGVELPLQHEYASRILEPPEVS